MKSSRLLVLRRRSLASALALILGSSPAWADYLLSSGDILDITVFRVPELSRQTSVDGEGQIAFPPLGLIDVAGASLNQVSETIRSRLARDEILSDAQVTVALAAARPIFVGGDVASPGAFPYQAGLSVRRAVALAGGLGSARTRGPEELTMLRSELEVLTADLLRENARLARARAELAGLDKLATETPAVPGSWSGEFLDLEGRRLLANVIEAEEEREHLARSLDLVVDRIDTLSTQAENQQRLIQRQTAEIDRYRQLQERGVSPQTRVVEEQRIFDSLVERAADTAAELTFARQQREDFAYALDRFGDRRDAALESEVQEALLAIEALNARQRGVAERMAQLGLAEGDQLKITVYRIERGQEMALEASEELILQPGDMVDIDIELPLAGLGSTLLPSPAEQGVMSSSGEVVAPVEP